MVPVASFTSLAAVFVEPIDLVADFGEAALEHVGRIVVRLGVDRVGRIDREEAEADGERAVDVGRRFQMVGIGAKVFGPAGGDRGIHRVGHHGFRRAVGAGHLADRLLRKDRRDPFAGAAHRLDVAGSSQPEPVAETETGSQAKGDGLGDGLACLSLTCS